MKPTKDTVLIINGKSTLLSKITVADSNKDTVKPVLTVISIKQPPDFKGQLYSVPA